MINKVLLMGRLGKDPMVRKLESGRVVANLSFATNEVFMKDGQRMESTEWHYLEMWDQQALDAERNFKKGSVLFVEGKLRTEKYIDQTGVEKQIRKVRVISYQLIDRYFQRNVSQPPPPNEANV